jgi:hypothetical protein
MSDQWFCPDYCTDASALCILTIFIGAIAILAAVSGAGFGGTGYE